MPRVKLHTACSPRDTRRIHVRLLRHLRMCCLSFTYGSGVSYPCVLREMHVWDMPNHVCGMPHVRWPRHTAV